MWSTRSRSLKGEHKSSRWPSGQSAQLNQLTKHTFWRTPSLYSRSHSRHLPSTSSTDTFSPSPTVLLGQAARRSLVNSEAFRLSTKSRLGACPRPHVLRDYRPGWGSVCGSLFILASLLRARMPLGAPGLTTRNKKLLGAPGIATYNKVAHLVCTTRVLRSGPVVHLYVTGYNIMNHHTKFVHVLYGGSVETAHVRKHKKHQTAATGFGPT